MRPRWPLPALGLCSARFTAAAFPDLAREVTAILVPPHLDPRARLERPTTDVARSHTLCHAAITPNTRRPVKAQRGRLRLCVLFPARRPPQPPPSCQRCPGLPSLLPLVLSLKPSRVHLAHAPVAGSIAAGEVQARPLCLPWHSRGLVLTDFPCIGHRCLHCRVEGAQVDLPSSLKTAIARANSCVPVLGEELGCPAGGALQSYATRPSWKASGSWRRQSLACRPTRAARTSPLREPPTCSVRHKGRYPGTPCGTLCPLEKTTLISMSLERRRRREHGHRTGFSATRPATGARPLQRARHQGCRPAGAGPQYFRDSPA